MNCAHSLAYLGPLPPVPPSAPFRQQRKLAWDQFRLRTCVLPVAFAYAIRGWPVFPCKPRDKKPLTEHGFKDATADVVGIRSFWRKWPDANVAIATGSASGLLVIDVDPRNGGNEQLAEFEKRHRALPSGYVVETSDGGRHFYFVLPEGVTVPCGKLAQGIDIKCEGGYVIAPPSLHPCGHQYSFTARGTAPENNPPAAPDWLLAECQSDSGAQANSQAGATVGVDHLHVSDEIKRLIREGKPKGQRSEAIFGVLRSMVMNGHTDDEIMDVMLNPEYGISAKPREKGAAWLRGQCKCAREKPDRDGEGSARDDGSESDGNQAGDHSSKQQEDTDGASSTAGSSKQTNGSKVLFKLLSVDDLKRMEPISWLVDGMLVTGSFAVLYGPPGIGKSFLALDLALSISTKTAGVADPTGCGPVVYVAAEGIGGLSKRVEAWERAHGRKAADIHFLPEAVNLIDKADTDKLIASIRGLPTPPLLIVIDTMARCLRGSDENSAKDVGQFVAMIDALRSAFKCAVLVVHHGTKSSPKTERGSSALRGAADTMLFLDSHFGALTLFCEKQKDASEFESLSLRLETVDLEDGETSCVVRSDGVGASGAGTSPNGHEKAILEILEAVGECGHAELEAKFRERTGRCESSFARALKRLKAAGSIKKTEAGKYVLA